MPLEGLNDDDIVISGIGCSAPGINNLEDLATSLFEGRTMVKHDDYAVPAGYYGELPEHHGHITDAWKCDCTFFGVSEAVARSMDPMVRKILEKTFEALVDAGLNPADIKGTNTAIYSGTTFSDHDLEWKETMKGGYGIMGRNRCMNANRISYWLDTKGTSVATDCNWANGLVNLELATNAIKNGFCDVAIVNGASITYHYELNIQVRDMGLLSMDGKTKSFDNAADGYVRSDGVVVLVLQRASSAKRCYASIGHVFSQTFASQENQYALSSQKQWAQFLKTFYEDSRIDPRNICYYEANGTAVRVEDAKELNAVAEVLCKDRLDPLPIGSVKSNLGHTEAASGLVSLVKAIICLEKMEAPKNLNYSEPNHLVPSLVGGQLKPITENTPLPKDGMIALSAYGYGGVYAHAVLKPNPKTRRRDFDSMPRLVLIADRTADTIDKVLDKIEAMPYNEEYYSLLHDVHSKKIGNYLSRGYTIVPKKEDTIYRETKAFNDEKRPVWFIFSGMGSQWNGMCKALLQLPIFRESMERSAEVMKKKNLDLMHIVTTDDKSVFDNILHSFVGIAATQIALVDILNALGIVPDGIIGHSVGELGCAYADRALTAEQMILCAYYRGLACNECNELIPGFMAAIGKGYNEIKDELPPEIDVACHNARDSCTLSGPEEIVKETVEKLKAEKVFAKTVNVGNIAFHSRYIQPLAPIVFKYLQTVIPDPKPRSSKWISTSNSEEEWDTDVAKFCSAEYQTKNLLSSVLFEEGSKHIPSNAICIEIAPHGLLQAILRRSLDPNCLNISMTHRSADDPLIYLFQSIGKMFIAGMHPRVSQLYRPIDYPVPRGTPSLTSLVHWNLEYEFITNFRVTKKIEHSIKNVLRKTNPELIGCVIGGLSVYPLSIYIRLAWETTAMYERKQPEDFTPVIKNLRLDQPFNILSTDLASNVTVMINTGTSYLEIYHKKIIGHMNIHSDLEQPIVVEGNEPVLQSLTHTDIYSEFEHRGYGYCKAFQSLEKVDICETVWKGYVRSTADWAQKLEALIQLVILREGEEKQALLFPSSIGRIMINPEEHLTAIETEGLVEIIYSIPQRTVTCAGIEIVDLRLRQLDPPKSTLSFQVNHVVPYDLLEPMTNDEFVEQCIHITNANMSAKRKAKNVGINVLRVIGLESSDLGANITEKFSDTDYQVHVKSENFVKDEPLTVDDSIDLVIGDFMSLKKAPLIAGKNSLILVRSVLPNGAMPAGYELVMKMKSKRSEELLLLTRVKDFEEDDEFLTITEDEPSLINIINNRMSKKNKTFYLISYNEPAGGVQSYVQNVEEATAAPIRWLFILDKTAPKFTKTNEIYLRQLRKGLANNVFHNGKWGFFEKKTFTEKVVDSELAPYKHIQSVGEIFYDFVSVNLESSKQQTTEVVTDFSGRLRTGTPVMGILKEKSTSLVHDPHLVWQVPSSWSQKDAATVPIPYLMAYYCIVHFGKILPYEKVLVTDGLSMYGRAAIAVALTKASAVYVTVASEEEKSIVLKLFPKLKTNHVFLHDHDMYDFHLGLEVGEENRPQIVINNLDGVLLDAALRCLNECSRIFHFGKDDIENNRQIASCTFLRYISMFKVSPAKIMLLQEKEKEELLGLMYEGLRTGVVKPFEHASITMDQASLLSGWTDTDKKMKKILLDPFSKKKGANELHIAPGYSYVIIGDYSGVWLDLAESLIQRGADNVVVVKPANEKSERTWRRVEFLKNQYPCNLIIYDEENIKPQALMKEVQLLGPLAAVFLISLEKQSNGFESKAGEIDKLWRDKKGHFIVISGGQCDLSKLCETRQAAGYPTTNLFWEADDKLIGSHLDTITKLSGREAIISVTDSIRKQNHVRNSGRTLLDSLPSSLEDFDLLGGSLGLDVDLVEMITAGGAALAKNLSPLIIIPGLQSDPVQIVAPLARRLKYPVLCAKLPNLGLQSIPAMASGIFQKYRAIRKRQTVNIVGISWGCVVALELAKQLENSGAKVAVTIIDNPLYPVQQGKLTNKTIESVLLSLVAKSTTQKEFTLQAWNDELAYTVNSLDVEPDERKNILASAYFLSNQLRSLLSYDLTQLRLKGPLTVLHSKQILGQDCSYTNVCSNLVVRDYPISHADLMASDALVDILHSLAICDDMILGNIHEASWTELESFLIKVTNAPMLNTNAFDFLSAPINLSEDDRTSIIL